MISDAQYYLEASYAPQDNNFNFSRKEYQIMEDQQKGSYAGGMTVNFDMAALGTNNKVTSWPESFLVIPLVLQLVSSNALTADRVNSFAASLKNGYHHIINSLKVQISNNEVCNSQLLTNLKIHYDIVSTWSNDDVKTLGSVINFCGLDSLESERYVPSGVVGAAGTGGKAQGVGLINNSITSTTLTQVGYTPEGGYLAYNNGNLSRRQRMMNTSFDPANTGGNSLLSGMTAQQCINLGKNYVSNGDSTAPTTAVAGSPIIFYITATIPMSVLHPLFSKLPLTKNMYMKIDLNLNTNFTVTANYSTANATTAGVFTSYSVSGTAPTCPFQISQFGTQTGVNTAKGLLSGTGGAGGTASTLTATIGIGKVGSNTHTFQSCRIYAACYTLSPIQEEEYFKAVPQKAVLYDDYLYSNTSMTTVVPGGQVFNMQLFPSISRIRGILIIPQLASAVHGTTVATLGQSSFTAANAGAVVLGSPMQSPFSSSPGTCCPFARVNNFNVFVGNTQWYPDNINYGWQMYNNEIRKNKNTPFGNSHRGICSGLIDQQSWETNHGYIYVNLDRWDSKALDNAPKTVGVSFTNACNFTCDYHCFLIYQREIVIQTSTGQLVKYE